jgi:methylornithine synthase
MRLACPDRLIPASLDIEGLTGLTPRLNAGANVVTSIVPPGHGLAGVAQSSFDISDSRRTTASVVAELGTLDLEPATIDEYRDWVAHRRGELGAPPLQERRVC